MIATALNFGYVTVFISVNFCSTFKYASFINIRIKGNENEIFEIQYYLETNGSLDPAELYRCPDGYEFDDNVLRCQKEEDVECEKTADSVQERLESPAITLQVSELDSFFRRWAF